MEQHEVKVIAKRRHIILDRATLLEKDIPSLERFLWT